jgi:hypothetical protein
MFGGRVFQQTVWEQTVFLFPPTSQVSNYSAISRREQVTFLYARVQFYTPQGFGLPPKFEDGVLCLLTDLLE